MFILLEMFMLLLKFAVKALSQSTRYDVLDKGIKVTSVDPGMVETEFSHCEI
jgi:NADP-dependent 3-hydroxy acid dehydrogenase YdfG